MRREEAEYRFVSGAAMAPAAVLAAYPGAQFVARAQLDAPTGEVWGILIRVLDSVTADTGAKRDVTTDDGRTFAASVAADGRPAGDPAAILAAAKYWELPPAYIKTLVPNG